MSTGESMTSPTSDASGHHRRDRAAIAAQACETCRTRKSKCDEKRPQCSLCKRLGVHCEYREPVPTKKDKTLVEILDSLQRMELKLDRLNSTDPTSSTSSQMDPAAAISSRGLSTVAGTPAGIDAGSKYATEAFIEPKPNRHVTAPHKVLLWPAIWTLLINSGHPVAQDVQRISQEGTPWILKLDMLKHQSTLPVNVSLESKDGPKYGVDSTIERRVLFPTLTQELMERYAVYYFDSYNVLYPLLDKEDFQRQHFWKVVQNGYGDGDISSVLCLLVFALGKVAEDGLYGRPLNRSDGQPSGLRGGSIQFPPGLDIFNEARRRLGFVALECTLESIQALMLTAYGPRALDKYPNG
ncbi:MAG: hypothetical protein M1820_001765 [Bogoriella megaspora]|nr:MAG: hypothetical protein M1820_001765 [Bogoriella megaspora]